MEVSFQTKDIKNNLEIIPKKWSFKLVEVQEFTLLRITDAMIIPCGNKN